MGDDINAIFYQMGSVLFEIFRGDVSESRDGIFCDKDFISKFKTPMVSKCELQVLDCLTIFNHSHLSGSQVVDIVSLYRCHNESKSQSRIDRLNSDIPDAKISLTGYKIHRKGDLTYRMAELARFGHPLAVFLADLLPLFEPQAAGGILDVARYTRDYGVNMSHHPAVLDVIRKHFSKGEEILDAPSVVQLVNALRVSSSSALRKSIECVKGIWAALGNLQSVSFESISDMRRVYRCPENCPTITPSLWTVCGRKRIQVCDSYEDPDERHIDKRIYGVPETTVPNCGKPNPLRYKLLILDLNKVLLCRHKRRRHRYFIRPYASEFVEAMSRMFSDIAVWTSGRPENVGSAVQEIFGNINLLFFWTQKQCTFVKLDNTRDEANEGHSATGGSSWNGEYKKDLSKVWRTFPQYNRHNMVCMMGRLLFIAVIIGIF